MNCETCTQPAPPGQRYCSRACYKSRALEPLAERFARKINRSGPVPAHAPGLGPCHVWTGSRDHHGYGTFNIDGKPVKAHRVAFFLGHGRWPRPSALHNCDGGGIGCVRIDHLREGTQAENSRDMVERGRHFQPGLAGAKHPNSKLTEAAVSEMRQRFAAGDSLKVLSEAFGVSRDNVGLIVRRKAWKHVA